ncbi:TetR/AcrR family transcriptional regulator C-terminal domain-containing protein [Streptomyces sp. E2N166]|uniref:TetR/AcrR family transcriptional regulator n=1 Tax=Streptomyces sp. E2N166 TaxID=1851909 RepID=UPI001EE8FA6F|nr:TetR/AcrR family transcriptional regulator C-terminal domain-containing protein [Streptomyces sp. E2N166]
MASALKVVDRDGLPGLSMRGLGIDAMALYRYASGKDELLDGLVGAFFLEVEADLGPDTDGDWRAGLHRVALATYRVAMRHPNVVPLLATRLLSSPLARRPEPVLRGDERVLALLAGLGDRRALALHRAFTAWLLGYLFVELRAMDDVPEERDPAFRLGLHRISAQDHSAWVKRSAKPSRSIGVFGRRGRRPGHREQERRSRSGPR